MVESRSLRQSYRYVVTIEGRRAIDDATVCMCKPRIAGLLVACEACGTVYGHLSDRTYDDVQRGKRD